MTCFYTILHLFKQKSKIEKEFLEFSEINLRKSERILKFDFLARNAIQKCNSASIQAKSKIERKLQEYSVKTLRFVFLPGNLGLLGLLSELQESYSERNLREP